MTDNNVIVFKDNELELEVNVAPEEDTVWLTQAQMAQLFQTTAQNITIHLKNIYNDDELDEAATCKDFLQVRQEGRRTVRRKQKYYNLDMIISVGYRVNSKRGIRFRKWATNILKQYVMDGVAVNEKKLAALNKTIDIQSHIIA
ncbi:virulence RhuM family protein, partial [Phascolarctobacterium faecium]